MKTMGVCGISVMMFLCLIAVACGQNAASIPDGERLFKLHCQVCHPGGKNIINPAKTLYPQDLKKSNIETPEAIVRIIRKAPPGMTSFDAKAISDKDAEAIARYIMQSFK